jgi:tetratricopeptide (TPR) repeat protein
MPKRLPFQNPIWQAVASTLALGVFVWGLSLQLPARGGAAQAPPSPEESRKLQEASAALIRADKWQAALEPTMKLHSAYPESHIYIGHLAEIYDHLGKYKEEAALWEEYLVRAPRPIEGCPQIGDAYQKQGLPQQAISAFEKCLAFEPYNPDSIFYLARAWERAGELTKSGDLYRRGIAVSPDYGDLQTGLGRVLLRQGQPEEAKAVAAKVLVRSPEDTDALLVMGLACQRMGNRKQAREYLERGVRLADTYTDFHLALARIAEQDSDVHQAIAQYERVAELDKTNIVAAQRLGALRGAQQ